MTPAQIISDLQVQLKEANDLIDQPQQWNDYWRKLANDMVLRGIEATPAETDDAG